jgi:glutamate/tyrosine decarboxylase-like PLP-dependent enzyme
MYIPHEVACVFVKDKELQRNTFTLTPGYLAHSERGLAGGPLWFSELGVQLSRNFRALKVWMSIKEHGSKKYARVIQQNINQANYLAELVKESNDYELLTPVYLNIVCFRYLFKNADDEKNNSMNKELILRLHESGKAAVSNTTINGKYGMRAAITNHRSKKEDFDFLLKTVSELAEEIQKEI